MIVDILTNLKNNNIMKKVVEFMMMAFFALFIMGVLVSLCGVGEFCGPLMLVGAIMMCAGFVLSVLMFCVGEGIEDKNR